PRHRATGGRRVGERAVPDLARRCHLRRHPVTAPRPTDRRDPLPVRTGKPAQAVVSGIVTLRGAIATSGTNPMPFTLPAAARPATDVYVPVDLCNATNGRLDITPSGTVTVEPEGEFSNAQCFTSLDGGSFARSDTSYTALTLQNGWTNAPFSTSNAAARAIGGVVHLKGAIATTGTSPIAFTLPAQFRPASDVYVPVDLCDATNGRLHILPGGEVEVQAEGGTFSNAQCFTSLDGASYVLAGTPTPLTLQNGWSNGSFSTRNAAVYDADGVVHLEGGIDSGTPSTLFTLPAQFRPATSVYVKVDLCNSTNGRLFIQANGTVTVNEENGTFANAQCFVSLDG